MYLNTSNNIVFTVFGGSSYGYCPMSLAYHYNQETKLIGKKITRRKVKEIPIFLGM